MFTNGHKLGENIFIFPISTNFIGKIIVSSKHNCAVRKLEIMKVFILLIVQHDITAIFVSIKIAVLLQIHRYFRKTSIHKHNVW